MVELGLSVHKGHGLQDVPRPEFHLLRRQPSVGVVGRHVTQSLGDRLQDHDQELVHGVVLSRDRRKADQCFYLFPPGERGATFFCSMKYCRTSASAMPLMSDLMQNLRKT